MEEFYLDHFFVEPEAMRRGVGARLWRYVVQQAQAMEHQQLC